MNPVTSTAQPARLPGLSGFNKSFKNLLSAQVGTLVPLMCDPVIPGTRVNLNDAFDLRLPPLASDTFMNMKFKQEAFFVPASSLYGGFNHWITKKKLQTHARGSSYQTFEEAGLPYIELSADAFESQATAFAAGSLADYLGFRGNFNINADFMPKVNPFPFLAYHRVWDRYYRNSLIQNPIFSPGVSAPDEFGSQNLGVSNLPYIALGKSDEGLRMGLQLGQDNERWITTLFNDDVDLFTLRQRNFGADYFTNATPTAQRGDPAAVNFSVDLTSGEGSISIAAIRSLNALQLFRERNNMADDDIHSYNRAHYNVKHTGYGESVPQYLGNHVQDVYSRPVEQTAYAEYQSNPTNPFSKSVGAEFGRAVCSGSGSLINGFEAPEYGYILVLGSLVPSVTYSTGVNRHLLDLVNDGGVTDIPDALLQQVGPQEVFKYELYSGMLGAGESGWDAGFGYQQRYAHYMTRLDECHGLFRDGQSLQSFALQRSFDASVALNGDFLQIPTDYLDQVAAVAGSIAQFGYWVDVYFDYKVSMPIAAYSIPSLENPAGPTEWITRPGAKLS